MKKKKEKKNKSKRIEIGKETETGIEIGIDMLEDLQEIPGEEVLREDDVVLLMIKMTVIRDEIGIIEEMEILLDAPMTDMMMITTKAKMIEIEGIKMTAGLVQEITKEKIMIIEEITTVENPGIVTEIARGRQKTDDIGETEEVEVDPTLMIGIIKTKKA